MKTLTKILSPWIIWSLAVSAIFGQNNIKIGIARFDQLPGIPENDARVLEDLCWSAFQGYYRYQVLDRTDMDAVYAALEKEKEETKLIRGMSEQGRAIGAEYLVLGQLNSSGPVRSEMGTYENRQTKVKSPFRSLTYPLRFTIRVLKTETGEILKSEVLEISGYLSFKPGDPEFLLPVALLAQRVKESAFYNAHQKMERFARNVFPGEVRVKLLLRHSNQKAKRLLVTGNKPITWREYLEVYQLEHIDVDGELLEYEVSLGLATVKDYMPGLSIAECKVNTGRKEIYEALQSGEPVYLRSTGHINMVGLVKFMLLPLTPFVFRRPKL